MCIGDLGMLSWTSVDVGVSSSAVRATFLAGLRNVCESMVSLVNLAFQPQQNFQLEESKRIFYLTQMAQACLFRNVSAYGFFI